MPSVLSPLAPSTLSLASSLDQLLPVLKVGTLFVPIPLLSGATRSISDLANFMLPCPIPCQDRTLLWWRISMARQSAQRPPPGPTPAERGSFIAMIAGLLGSISTPGNWLFVLVLGTEQRTSAIMQGKRSQLYLFPWGSNLLGVRGHRGDGFVGFSTTCLGPAGSSLGYLVLLVFCFMGFLQSCFHFNALIRREGCFCDLFVLVGVFFGFSVKFLLFLSHEFLLLCFALISIYLPCFQ